MILIVDDEEVIIKVSTRVLERNGYDVLSADTVGSALELDEVQAGSIDLAIIDYKLPDGEGWEVAKGLWEKNSATKILLSSGYPDIEPPDWLDVPQGCLDTISKPYGMQQLADKVKAFFGS